MKTIVQLSERFNNDVIVAQGLKVGDTVVTAGQLKLFDGAHILDSQNPEPQKAATTKKGS